MNIGFDAKRAFKNFTGLGNYSRFVVKSLSDHYPKNEYFLYSPMGAIHNEEVTDSCTNTKSKNNHTRRHVEFSGDVRVVEKRIFRKDPQQQQVRHFPWVEQ